MKNIGIVLSSILHPIVVILFTFWYIIYNTGLVLENQNILFAISLFFSVFLPIINVIYLKKIDLITDFDATNRNERLLPLAFGVLFFLIGYITLSQIGSPQIIQAIMFCNMINTIIVWLITKEWKISIHTMTLGASFAIFWFLGYQYPTLMIILTFLTFFSRYILHVHNISQLSVGIIIGIVSTLTQLLLLFEIS